MNYKINSQKKILQCQVGVSMVQLLFHVFFLNYQISFSNYDMGGPEILLVESRKGPEKVMENWKCHRKSAENWEKCHV